MAKTDTNPLVIIATLGLSAGLGPASMTLVTPSLPAIEAALGISPFLIAVAQSVFLLGLAVPQLVFGAFSDRFGHRPPLIVGMILFVVGSLICVVTPNFEWLVVGRVLQAVGASSGMVTSRALVRELYPTERAAAMLGYMTVGMMVIPMLAPVAGGYIQSSVGWRGNFALLSAISILLVATVSAMVPNVVSRRPPPSRSTFEIYARLLRSKVFRYFTWQTILPSFLAQTFFATAPFVLEQHYRLSPNSYGTLFAIPAVCFMMGNLMSGRLAERLGVSRMMGLGTAATCALSLPFAAIFLAGSLSVFWMFLFVGALTFGHGLVVPSATASATSALDSSFGSAAGMLGFLQFALSGFGVLVLVPAASFGPSSIVLSYVVVSAVTFGMYLARTVTRDA